MKFGVIFDLDGVLVNSNKYILESFNELVKRKNFVISNDDFESYRGKSLKTILESLNKRYGINLEFGSFDKESAEIQIEKIRMNEKPDKALISLLEELKNYNVPFSVGTGSVKWRANRILRTIGLRDYFEIIVSVDDVAYGKPAPHIFLKAAEKMNLPPHLCVVVEDADSGVQAAKDAGMKVVGFRGYNTSFVNSNLGKADIVVNNFSELNYFKLARMIS
jgi:HAD superfamily hydrolase (TIGR01509 family)